jgi:LysM repeat protein
MNYNSLRNRIVITVAGLGIAMSAMALNLPTRTVNGNVYYYYEVQSKETIYGLAHRFGLTKAQIIQYNPAVSDGLRSGQMLYFPKDEVDQLTSIGSSTRTHEVKKGETIYGISHQYGITESQLIAANPGLGETGLKYGSVLTIPSATSETAAATAVTSTTATTTTATKSTTAVANTDNTSRDIAEPTTVQPTPGATPEVEDTSLLSLLETKPATSTEPTAPTTINADTLRITVMLPFMLSTQRPDKQAQLYTEYYRGLLMAADSLRTYGKPLVISAYDTSASIDSVNAILDIPEVAKSTVIIAPDDDLQLGRIASFAKTNGNKVFNVFAVKSSLYCTNSAMMQANIPHSAMYDTAVAGLLNEYPDYTPVLLIPQEGGKTDKIEFQNRLRTRAKASGRNIVEIKYTGTLKTSDLSALTEGSSYIFVPASGTQTEFSRVIATLKEYKEGLIDYNQARLFGYPEWITFRSETLENMRYMNTTIYSRFYNDDSSLRSKSFTADYTRWYGTSLMNAIPVQGILGFDTGMYLIRAINNADSFPSSIIYQGIQSDFHFESDGSNAGTVNNALYLINFRPSGITEKISL